jgi:carbon monoxide dehydrogenase subunit G
MFTISRSVCIDAPAASVWRVLSELESIHLWVEAIRHSHCEGSTTRGRDAVRVCELGGNLKVRETIVDWIEGSSFAYTGEGAPLTKRAVNRWTVEERGSQSLVTTTAEVALKGGIFGRILEPLFAAVAGRMGSRSLASLKFYVENGTPYAGKARDLLPVPAAC